jgi:ABC-type transport system involved in multi-copper enzyme maturation permease subunit
MRQSRTHLILLGYLLVTALVTALMYVIVLSEQTSYSATSITEAPILGKTIFLTVMTTVLLQVCIITQTLTSGAIVGEKERQSYDLLVTTMLTPWDIIIGKLLAALAFILLLIFSAFPIASLSFFFGGVSGAEFLIAIFGIVVTGFLYSSIGIFWSTVARTTWSSTIFSQITVFGFLLGIPFLFIVGGFLLLPGIAEIGPSDSIFHPLMAILGLHPFLALGITETLISNGKGIFFFSEGQTEWIISPWVWNGFLSTFIAMQLLFISKKRLISISHRHSYPPNR